MIYLRAELSGEINKTLKKISIANGSILQFDEETHCYKDSCQNVTLRLDTF